MEVEDFNTNESLNISNTMDSETKSSVSKFVSQEYLERIRAKDRVSTIYKEIQKVNEFYNKKRDFNKIFKDVLLQIKTILMTNKKSFELSELSETLLNSNKTIKDNFYSVDKLNHSIIEFCKNNKEFIKLINHSRLGLIILLENINYIIPDEFPFMDENL